MCVRVRFWFEDRASVRVTFWVEDIGLVSGFLRFRKKYGGCKVRVRVRLS